MSAESSTRRRCQTQLERLLSLSRLSSLCSRGRRARPSTDALAFGCSPAPGEGEGSPSTWEEVHQL